MGQLVSWSNLVNVHAFTCFAETLDFGGAHVGEAFIRQGQTVILTVVSHLLLKPIHICGDRDESKQSVPDIIARYDFKGDWGQANVGALFRVDQSGIDETAVGFNAQPKSKLAAK